MGREFGWTLDEMRQLRASELRSILDELQRQMALEEYNEQLNHWAFLAATIVNAIGAFMGMFSKKKHKAVSPDDFINKEAKEGFKQLLGQASGQQVPGTQKNTQQKDWSKHIEDAKAKGLKGGESTC